jgi:hypothetical protein
MFGAGCLVIMMPVSSLWTLAECLFYETRVARSAVLGNGYRAARSAGSRRSAIGRDEAKRIGT